MTKTPNLNIQNQEVYLAGAILRDPELRYTPSGTAVMTVTLGGTETAGDRALPYYVEVRFLGNSAERWADRLKPGLGLVVVGRLEFSQWEKEGVTHSKVEVVVRRAEAFGLSPEDLVEPDQRGSRRLSWGVNRVWCVGNLTREVELRYTSQGDALASGRIAISEGEKSHFVDWRAWRGVAEAVAGLGKGERVWIEGRLSPETWTTSDGSRRYALRLEATRVRKLERFKEGAAEGTATAGASPSKAVPKIDQGLEDFPPEEDLPF